MKILLIEDDVRLSTLVARVLIEEGLGVDAVQDGESGLDLALRGQYDVAVIDWMLPGRDGPAICRAIRAHGLPTALLLLTARGQIEDRVAGLDSSAGGTSRRLRMRMNCVSAIWCSTCEPTPPAAGKRRSN